MNTRDVVLGSADGWLAVVPSGTFAYIHNPSEHAVRYRFGIDSTSQGIPMSKGGYIKVNEVVYIKNGLNFKARLVVMED